MNNRMVPAGYQNCRPGSTFSMFSTRPQYRISVFSVYFNTRPQYRISIFLVCSVQGHSTWFQPCVLFPPWLFGFMVIVLSTGPQYIISLLSVYASTRPQYRISLFSVKIQYKATVQDFDHPSPTLPTKERGCCRAALAPLYLLVR